MAAAILAVFPRAEPALGPPSRRGIEKRKWLSSFDWKLPHMPVYIPHKDPNHLL